MRYWYRLSESEMWENAYMEGVDNPEMPPVYVETEEILKDFESDPFSDWWPIKGFGDGRTEFQDEEDAKAELYANLDDSLYCRIHDC